MYFGLTIILYIIIFHIPSLTDEIQNLYVLNNFTPIEIYIVDSFTSNDISTIYDMKKIGSCL